MCSLRIATKSESFTQTNLTRSLAVGASAAVLALVTAMTGAHAQSQPTTGFYIGGAVGANLEENNRLRGGGGTSTDSYGAGPAGTLSFGYGLGNGLRLELEP